MKIHIDGRYYDLPQEVEDRLLSQFYLLFANLYMSEIIPKALRIAVKPIARHELEKKEKALNQVGYDGKVVRPINGGDPALRFLELEIGKLRGEGKLKDVILHIQTEADAATISAFAVSIPRQGESRGFDTSGRDAWERQDSSGEVPGPGRREVVPYE